MGNSNTPGFVALVLNAASSTGGTDDCKTAIEAAFAELNRSLTFFIPKPHEDIAAACMRAAEEVKNRGGCLAVAGGDGSVNAAAMAAREHDVPLGIIPTGTFNYFARLYGIPSEIAEAARVIAEGTTQVVDVGEVNSRLFLNNASFGLYTRIIHSRERHKARFGRYRIVAMLSSLGELLQGQKPFSVRIASDEGVSIERTSMVSVVNNPLQLEVLEPDTKACVQAGSLGVLLLKPTRLRDRVRLMLRTALKELEQDHRLLTFCTTELEVESRRASIELVIDGEITKARTPLLFRAVPKALHLLVPKKVT